MEGPGALGRALVTLLLIAAAAADAAPAQEPPGDGSAPPVPVAERGLAVGARVPPFEAPDQSGRPRTFASLAGPKGLVLVFVRSADW